MKYRIAQVIGLNTDQEAAQVISSSREDNNIFFGVLQVRCDDAFTKGRQVLTDLMDNFFDSPSNENEPVAKRLSDIFALAKEELEGTEIIHILLGSVSGKALYIIFEGEASAYLKRAGKLSSLLSVGQPKQLISGFLQEKDRVFFGTANLARLLGDDLTKSIDSPLNDWEEDITIRISTSSLNNQGLAGLLLEVVPEQEEQAGVKKVNDEYAVDNFEPKVQATTQNNPSKRSITSLKSFLPKLFSKTAKNEEVPDQETELYPSTKETRNKLLFLKKLFPKSGRAKLILGILLILIVVSGVVYQFKKNQNQEQQQSLNQLLQQAREDLAAAESISTLNAQEAKVKLESAKSTIEKALAVKANDQQALDLKRKIAEDGDKILQQFAANFPVYLELDLIKPGLRPERMSLSGNNLLILDPTGKSLVSIDLTKKSQEVLAGEEQLGNAKFATINDDFSFIFSEDKGIVKIDVSNQKATSVVKSDKSLIGAVDIVGFGANIYLLDKTGNQIWKFVGTTSGYSDKREYLSKSVKVDFSSAKRMQIESSIYVLKEEGEILRFLKGTSEPFSYSGLDIPVKDPKSFFVSSDVENLYMLDSGNARLLVLDKTGVYKSQYQGELFRTASDLVVDEKGKKVYLLEGGKIYITDLK